VTSFDETVKIRPLSETPYTVNEGAWAVFNPTPLPGGEVRCASVSISKRSLQNRANVRHF